MRIFVDFGLLLWAIGLITSRHVVIQSKVTTKPIFSFLHTFSIDWRQVYAFVLGYDCFIGLSGTFIIGQSDDLRFGFMIHNWKQLL